MHSDESVRILIFCYISALPIPHARLKTGGNINSCSFSGVSFHKELNFNYSSVKLFSSPTNSRLFQHKQVSVEIKLKMKHSIIGNTNGCVRKVFLLIVL